MKKILLFALVIGIISIAGTSCNNQKTAQELLKEEKKATDRFIKSKGFVILNEYPASGVFGEKEYFRTKEGLYIQVIDSGNGTRATALKTTVIGRFKGLVYFKTDTTTYSTPTDIRYQPDSFVYGLPQTYGGANDKALTPGMSCAAWGMALTYVGDESEVSLIIPSDLSISGDQSNFKPSYIKSLKFRFN